MHQSIEEEELTAQRDAAVSLFKGLQAKVGWVNVLIAKKKGLKNAARLNAPHRSEKI